MKENPYISIMGDSISTYAGCNPAGCRVYYQGYNAVKNELYSPAQTWWHQVIEALNGRLCVNHADSGSRVSGAGFPAAASERRIGELSAAEAPDCILVYMGLNDFGFGVLLGKPRPVLGKADPLCFYGAYDLMVRRMKKRYPKAEIICATLLETHVKQDPQWRLSNGFAGGHSLKQYNRAIRQICRRYRVRCADLEASGTTYETLDGAHPTGAGHKTLAQCWIAALGGIQ